MLLRKPVGHENKAWLADKLKQEKGCEKRGGGQLSPAGMPEGCPAVGSSALGMAFNKSQKADAQGKGQGNCCLNLSGSTDASKDCLVTFLEGACLFGKAALMKRK